MPAELVPGGIRVQAIFQGKSGLPEDRYVNVWHFADVGGGPTVEADLIEAAERVRRFYVELASPAEEAVQASLAKDVMTLAECHLRAYDLSQPDPREPVIVPFTGLAGGSGTAMPSEVALCLSFYSGVNAPSSRGRIYLGPLWTRAMAVGGAPAFANTVLRVALIHAARRLQLESGSIWSILTHPGGGLPVLKTVTNGWVDTSFDTVRKRGEGSLGRNTWSVSGVA